MICGPYSPCNATMRDTTGSNTLGRGWGHLLNPTCHNNLLDRAPGLLLATVLTLCDRNSQVALRKFLGDPWPTMVMHPGGGYEDRMTFIEAINEATRLGSNFGGVRSQEAQR